MIRWRRQLLCSTLVGLALAAVTPAASQAAALRPALLAKAGYGSTPPSFVRTADGTLHVVLAANTNWGDAWNGIGALSISSSGHVGPDVQALAWHTSGGSPSGVPGVTALPGGSLEAVFGGAPGGDNGPWGIASTDGGASWSAPIDVGSGTLEGGGAMTLQNSNGTPVLTEGCCGLLVAQDGFGSGVPTYQVTNSADGDAGNVATAVDAQTGAVIASWDSIGTSAGLWLQQVGPSQGTAQKAPVPKQYGTGVPLVLAGRDSGPGVFASYPANYGNTTKMRVLQYGGGSRSVGSVRQLFAHVWGTATGSDGRLWVMWWGQNTKNGKFELAVTRSNTAINRFEPIQVFSLGYSSLFTLSGDGRLGPLDMLINGTPSAPGAASGVYYARVVPELSATVTAQSLGAGRFGLKVHVTDAGDPVTDASAGAKSKRKATGATGRAKLQLSGQSGQRVTVTITAPGYRSLKKTITL